MQKKVLALLLALAMLLGLLTGCGDANAPAADGDEADTSTSSDATEDSETEEAESLPELPEDARTNPIGYLTNGTMAPDDVVMTVNGTEIPAKYLIYWMCYQYTYASYFYAQYGMALDVTQDADDQGTTIAQSLADQSANIAQMNTVLRAEAEEDGLTMTEEQTDAMADLHENYDANTLLFYATDMDTLEQAYSDSCLATNLRGYLFDEGGEMAPTMETLADYAEEHGVYTCRYILLSTNDLEEDDQEGRDAQKELAEDLLAQLQACDPEDLEETFTQLQEEYNVSDGNTSRYTFDNDDSLVTGFREKLAELEVGQLGLTDETDYGYFVLLRLDTDLDTVWEDYASSSYDALVAQWMDEADVTTTEALDNLDMVDFYSKLIDLQTVLSSEMAAAAEDEAETETDADTQTETETETDADTQADGETETDDTQPVG